MKNRITLAVLAAALLAWSGVAQAQYSWPKDTQRVDLPQGATIGETLGPELLTQTCAGWGLTTPVGAWSCADGVITRTASAANLTITNSAAVAATVYKACVSYATITAGTFGITVGGKTQATHGTAGTYCEYIPAGTTATVTITAVAASAGTITVSTTSVKAKTDAISPAGGPVVLSSTLADATANESAVTVISNQAGAGGSKTALTVVNVGSGTSVEYGQEWYGDATQRGYMDKLGNFQHDGNMTHGGLVIHTAQSVTCTDGAGVSALTITPSSAYIEITNADVDGCNVTMSESGAVAGSVVRLALVSTAGGNVAFADSAGVLETSGSTFNMDSVGDNMTLIYSASAWNEASRAGN